MNGYQHRPRPSWPLYASAVVANCLWSSQWATQICGRRQPRTCAQCSATCYGHVVCSEECYHAAGVRLGLGGFGIHFLAIDRASVTMAQMHAALDDLGTRLRRHNL